MRALLPLAVLTLAACDGPLEELYPPRFYTVDRAGITYEARAQFDPFERGWFVRVLSIEAPLEAEDAELALSIAEAQVGPLVCDGNLLDVEPGEVWNPLAGDQVEFLEGLGGWHLVGRCTDQPAPAIAVAIFADGAAAPEGAFAAEGTPLLEGALAPEGADLPEGAVVTVDDAVPPDVVVAPEDTD